MGIDLFVILLIAFMLVAALIAVESRDLLSSVIALGAAGFALSVIDLLLGAPDLAITQVVVEVIALVLLVRLVITRREVGTDGRRDLLRTGATLLASGVLLAAGFYALGGAGGIPKFGEPVLAGKAVLLDYRAYDTLGEATVIFVSVLGVYAILRRVGRKPRGPADLREESP